MTAMHRHPGGEPVACLDALPDLERQVIRALRQWCAGPGGPGAVADAFASRLGEPAGRRLAAEFGELLGTVAGHARRPLLGHAPDCPCAGGDECVFARFVALAAEGSREEATLMAALIVRADLALCLVARAEAVGLGLMRHRTPRILQ